MRMFAIWLALFLIFATGCGGSSRLTSDTVSGAYEFVVTSNVTGSVTLVEANLAASGGQSTASGPGQAQVLTLENKTWYVNGVCPGAMPGNNSVAVGVNASHVALMFNEGGNTLPGQGVLTGSTITGNYSITGSTCQNLVGVVGFPAGTDSGGFVGNQVPQLSGTYAGSLNLPSGNDNAALTLMENPDHTLTVDAVLTGPVDNGTFSLTGSTVGNVMFVSGSVSGQTFTLFGYFDHSGTFTGVPKSMLVFNYDTLAEAGLLTGQ